LAARTVLRAKTDIPSTPPEVSESLWNDFFEATERVEGMVKAIGGIRLQSKEMVDNEVIDAYGMENFCEPILEEIDVVLCRLQEQADSSGAKGTAVNRACFREEK
jgi:hypothetical protein